MTYNRKQSWILIMFSEERAVQRYQNGKRLSFSYNYYLLINYGFYCSYPQTNISEKLTKGRERSEKITSFHSQKDKNFKTGLRKNIKFPSLSLSVFPSSAAWTGDLKVSCTASPSLPIPNYLLCLVQCTLSMSKDSSLSCILFLFSLILSSLDSQTTPTHHLAKSYRGLLKTQT